MNWIKNNIVQIILIVASSFFSYGKLQGQVEKQDQKIDITAKALYDLQQERLKRIEAYELLMRDIISKQASQDAKLDIILRELKKIDI